MNQDNGDNPLLFALDDRGRVVSRQEIDGIDDLEDIATARDPVSGAPLLFLGGHRRQPPRARRPRGGGRRGARSAGVRAVRRDASVAAVPGDDLERRDPARGPADTYLPTTEAQGEAVAFTTDGAGLVSTSEGDSPPLFHTPFSAR